MPHPIFLLLSGVVLTLYPLKFPLIPATKMIKITNNKKQITTIIFIALSINHFLKKSKFILFPYFLYLGFLFYFYLGYAYKPALQIYYFLFVFMCKFLFAILFFNINFLFLCFSFSYFCFLFVFFVLYFLFYVFIFFLYYFGIFYFVCKIKKLY